MQPSSYIEFRDCLVLPGPFSLDKYQKDLFLFPILQDLTELHYGECSEYAKILETLFPFFHSADSFSSLPYIPVRLFKNYELSSIPSDAVFKKMRSSGTSNQTPSLIILDRNTAQLQTRILVNIVSEYFGKTRKPMLVIDKSSILKNRTEFSARGAAILGFSFLANNITYALNEDNTLNREAIYKFFEDNSSKENIVFGFTSIIWEQLFNNAELDFQFNFENSTLLHGGGWKKLQNLNISNDAFRQRALQEFHFRKIINYYGLVEQTGSIFLECEFGYFHCSNYSNIIIREHISFSDVECKDSGIVQLQSAIPGSYPGHSILTEDLGQIFGEDDCPCGRNGKRFKILGRVPNAEIRGCSDVSFG